MLCQNATDPCGNCDHNKASHSNGIGLCIGYHCHCSRYIKQTAQVRQIKAMRQALSVVIDMLEEWPTDDEKNRNIRVGSPTFTEKTQMIAQLRKALETQ
jgi:hypothetical protein